MALSHDEIFNKVKVVLVEALSVDDDEITPESTLEGDLGAESIDYLDIVFRLEKSFVIKINQGELFPETVFNDPRFAQDGKLTDEGVAELRRRLPYIDLSKLDQNRSIADFSSVFTVNDLVKFVETKLG